MNEDIITTNEAKAKPLICFDVDDTLYMRSQPFIEACRLCFGHLFTLPWEEVSAARFRHWDQAFEDVLSKTITLEESYVVRITRTLQDFGQTITPEQAIAFDHCFKNYPADRKIPGWSGIVSIMI